MKKSLLLAGVLAVNVVHPSDSHPSELLEVRLTAQGPWVRDPSQRTPRTVLDAITPSFRTADNRCQLTITAVRVGLDDQRKFELMVEETDPAVARRTRWVQANGRSWKIFETRGKVKRDGKLVERGFVSIQSVGPGTYISAHAFLMADREDVARQSAIKMLLRAEVLE